MRLINLIVAIATFGLCQAAVAQTPPEDVVVRPDQLTATLKAQGQSLGRVPTDMCLILAGADPLDSVNHLSCVSIASDPDPLLSLLGLMVVSNPLGAGNVEYQAIVTLTDVTGLVISEPSPNMATVQDLPLPPTLLAVILAGIDRVV